MIIEDPKIGKKDFNHMSELRTPSTKDILKDGVTIYGKDIRKS